MFPYVAIFVIGGGLIYLGFINYRHGEDVLGRAFLPTLFYGFGTMLFVFGMDSFYLGCE
jgi:hypothetical protein